jgi:hypothetical protein
MIWNAIALVTSGLTLAAFFAAVGAWVYRLKILEKEKLIKSASEGDRAALVASALEFFDVETGNLTKQQQFEIALVQIHARARRFLITSMLIAVVSLLAAGLAAFAFVTSTNGATPPATMRWKIIDAETEGPIYQNIRLHYVRRGGAKGDEVAREGSCTVEGELDDVKAEDIRIENAKGYRLSADKTSIVDDRVERVRTIRLDRIEAGHDPKNSFTMAIRPETPEIAISAADYDTQMGRIPDPPPANVELQCTNTTKDCVEVFMYRHVPVEREDEAEFLPGWYGPKTCPPGETTVVYPEVGTNAGGYFYIYGSRFGLPGTELAKGNLYKSSTASLVITLASSLAEGERLRGVLSH